MDTQTIERTTLSNLIYNENYARKVLPFIKGKYFEVREERIIFEEISNFVDKYKKIPTQTSLEIEVGERKDLSEIEYKKVVDIIKTLNPVEVDFDWLVDHTEKFCKDKAIHNAIVMVYLLLMGGIRIELQTLYQAFLRMPSQYLLITLWVMIILTMLILDSNITIE